MSEVANQTAQKVLSPEMQKQLEQLRDIRLPEPISWWPLAWGWWALLTLVLLVLVAWLIQYYRGRIYRSAIAELTELQTLSQAGNTIMLSRKLSELLKRVAIFRQRQVQVLSGQAWADYLTQGDFSNEQAEFVAFASYANPDDYSAPEWNALEKNARQWIKRQFKHKGGLE